MIGKLRIATFINSLVPSLSRCNAIRDQDDVVRKEDVSLALNASTARDDAATGTRPMRQVGRSKKDSRRRSDSVSTANTARRDHRGSPPYGKMHTHRGGGVRATARHPRMETRCFFTVGRPRLRVS